MTKADEEGVERGPESNCRLAVTTTTITASPFFPKFFTRVFFPDREPFVLVSDNGTSSSGLQSSASHADHVLSSSIEVDAVTEAELLDSGFRSTSGFDQLESLAVGGKNLALQYVLDP
ncbi:hypothetical protein ACFX2B_026468 [Malus domestica]